MTPLATLESHAGGDESMLSEAWQLSPSVALRPEPFGALAYHFGTRRLTFLKRPELVVLVKSLGGATDVRAALGDAGVPREQWTAYVAALKNLAQGGMIRRRRAPAPEGALQ